MNILQIIETPRLNLIPLSLNLKKALLENRAKFTEMVNFNVPEGWPGPDFAEALPFFIQEMEKSPDTIWDGMIVHKTDATIIGDMGFMGGPDEDGSIEIGYSILPEYRNQGYATEMARGLINWAFQQPSIKAVQAECLNDNLSSVRVLEKVGMSQIGKEENMLKWVLNKL